MSSVLQPEKTVVKANCISVTRLSIIKIFLVERLEQQAAKMNKV